VKCRHFRDEYTSTIEDNYAVNVVDEPRVSAVSLHLEIPVEHMLCVGISLIK